MSEAPLAQVLYQSPEILDDEVRITASLDEKITIEGTVSQLAEHIRVRLPGVGGRK